MDQRKVNVLAREYCDDIKRKNKPIILSHREWRRVCDTCVVERRKTRKAVRLVQ